MPKVALYTLGCKVSQYETEAISEAFSARGFEVVDFKDAADVYVINTCTVTAESDRKSRQIIRRATKRLPRPIVAVIGCYSQRAPGEVAKIPGVDIVIGTQNKLSVVDLAIDMLGAENLPQYICAPSLDGAKFEPMSVMGTPRTRAYVKIEDGCEAKCTYCAISGARGPVRSKAPADVISEVEALSASGVREVVLTGIETGSYGKDFDYNYTLADLIVELDKRKSVERIRLGSLAPELVGENFCRRVGGVKILAPHFHLSMQSGSDNVLRRMKRRYSRKMALDNISALRAVFPNAEFTTDLMVGFPGESEDDFLKSISFVREVGLIDAHVFAYSRREGTPAYDYDEQIPEDIKRRRSAELIKVCREVRTSILEKIIERGDALDVILETEKDGIYTAHSAQFAEVSVSAPRGMTGAAVKVLPVSQKNGVIYGKIV